MGLLTRVMSGTQEIEDVNNLTEELAEKATTRDLDEAISTHGHDINLKIDLGQINHTHLAKDITDLADYISTGGSVDLTEIEQDITDLQTAVATKAEKEHSHAVADITG